MEGDKAEEMNRTKRGFYNLICSAFGQIVIIVLGFLLPRLFIVNYGSEINGMLNSLNQIFVYLALFEAGVGAVTLQALYMPVALDDKNKINGILSATNIYYKKTGAAYFAALLVLATIYPLMVEINMSYVKAWITILFYGLGNVIVFFFQGKYKILLQAEGNSYIVTNLTTLITILNNLVKIVLIMLGFDVYMVIIGSFLINLIQMIYIVVYIHKKYSWIDLSVKPNYEAVSQKNSMLVHQISGVIFQNTDVLLLTFMGNLKVVSVYSMYKLVVTHISSFLNIIFNSISFALGQIFNTDKKRFNKIIDAIELYNSTFSFAVYTVVLLVFIPFMRLYTRNVVDVNYIDNFLPWLFILIELLTVMRTPMLNTINYAGHFKETLPQTIIETVINIGVSILLMKKYGMYGVLIGTIVALLYRTNDIIIYTNKKILKRNAIKTYLIYATNFALLVLSNIIGDKYTYLINSYMSLFAFASISLLISILAFVCVQSTLFKNESKYACEIILNYIKQKVLKRRR